MRLPSTLESTLGYACTCAAVRRAARHVTQAYDRHLAPTGLRTSQFSLLSVLAADGPCSVGALAAALGLDRTTLGRNLRPLERDGLVSIAVDAQDRRGRALAITKLGSARLDDARACWATAQASFEARYGAEATRSLHDTLENLSRLDLAG